MRFGGAQPRASYTATTHTRTPDLSVAVRLKKGSVLQLARAERTTDCTSRKDAVSQRPAALKAGPQHRPRIGRPGGPPCHHG